MVVLAHQITHFFPADAIRWTKQPEKPTILEEGRSLVHLVWKFLIEGTSEGAEILRGVTFRRQRDAGDSPVVIARNRNGGAFTVFPQFRSNYSATIPATLNLRRAVAEEPDFIYSIEVSFLRNNLPQPGFRDAVQVIVRGKGSCFSRFPPFSFKTACETTMYAFIPFPFKSNLLRPLYFHHLVKKAITQTFR